jgi:hypothetical protein
MERGKLWDSGIDGKAIFIISKVFVAIFDANNQYHAKHMSGVYLIHMGVSTVTGPRYEPKVCQIRSRGAPHSSAILGHRGNFRYTPDNSND